MRHNTLAEWLTWQEAVHPRSIDLGLDRCRDVAERMALFDGMPRVVTVAGTNGKGSCVAMLEGILNASGLKTAAYTSPHLLRYNECVRVSGTAVDDDTLMRAFEFVDQSREGTSLTWFEFRTLAAAAIFREECVDVALLEVGLGGRLDAVNLFDSEVALISSLGLDHTEWLGDSLEDVAREKAGVFRAGRPAVCCEPDPPNSMREYAARVAAPLHIYKRDFDYAMHQSTWDWWFAERRLVGLPHPKLSGARQHRNAAGVLTTVALLDQAAMVTPEHIGTGLARASAPGRAQIVAGDVEHVYDIAHNPQAAQVLAQTLEALPAATKTHAVCGMLKDKDIGGMLAAMRGAVDLWYLADVPGGRGAPASDLARHLDAPGVSKFDDIVVALNRARERAQPGERIVVFGCFEVVRRALRASGVERGR